MLAGFCCSVCLLDRDAIVRLREDGSCALCAGEDPIPYMTESELAYYVSQERSDNLRVDPNSDPLMQTLKQSTDRLRRYADEA